MMPACDMVSEADSKRYATAEGAQHSQMRPAGPANRCGPPAPAAPEAGCIEQALGHFLRVHLLGT